MERIDIVHVLKKGRRLLHLGLRPVQLDQQLLAVAQSLVAVERNQMDQLEELDEVYHQGSPYLEKASKGGYWSG